MKVKLLHCRNCDEYFIRAYAKIAVGATVHMDKEGTFWFDDPDADFPEGVPVVPLSLSCNSCDSDEVYIMDMECPHFWREGSQYKVCTLCGLRQKKRIEWEWENAKWMILKTT